MICLKSDFFRRGQQNQPCSAQRIAHLINPGSAKPPRSNQFSSTLALNGPGLGDQFYGGTEQEQRRKNSLHEYLSRQGKGYVQQAHSGERDVEEPIYSTGSMLYQRPPSTQLCSPNYYYSSPSDAFYQGRKYTNGQHRPVLQQQHQRCFSGSQASGLDVLVRRGNHGANASSQGMLNIVENRKRDNDMRVVVHFAGLGGLVAASIPGVLNVGLAPLSRSEHDLLSATEEPDEQTGARKCAAPELSLKPVSSRSSDNENNNNYVVSFGCDQ
ncbi:hypothetical protein Ciccas_005405 [Cichlidogyrus casuarinus]|uniref:Uncharacterized protein n=1 Tax=Cichlidogyrus casuarinus TaxID=1844966 RepID=A0ABD2Q8R9_9PLAT